MISQMGGYPVVKLLHLSNDSKVLNSSFLINMHLLGNLSSGFCTINFNDDPQNVLLNYCRSSTTRLIFTAKISSSERCRPNCTVRSLLVSSPHISLIFPDVSTALWLSLRYLRKVHEFAFFTTPLKT